MSEPGEIVIVVLVDAGYSDGRFVEAVFSSAEKAAEAGYLSHDWSEHVVDAEVEKDD